MESIAQMQPIAAGMVTDFNDQVTLVWKTKVPKTSSSTMRMLLIGFLVMCSILAGPAMRSHFLMNGVSYKFWVDSGVAASAFTACSAILVAYVLCCAAIVQLPRVDVHVEDKGALTLMGFVVVTGLVLVMFALPLAGQAEGFPRLMTETCDYSRHSVMLHEYWAVLQNIRSTERCRQEDSVETCAGYEEAQPYTEYLRYLEDSFRCSGFCTPLLVEGRPAPVADAAVTQQQAQPKVAEVAEDSAMAPPPPEFGTDEVMAPRPPNSARNIKSAPPPPPPSRRGAPNPPGVDNTGKMLAPRPPRLDIPERPMPRARRPSALLQLEAAMNATQPRPIPQVTQVEYHARPTALRNAGGYQKMRPMYTYPLRLFGNGPTAMTCDGAAGKDVRETVGTTSRLFWLQGLALLASGIAFGLMETLSLCMDDKYSTQAPA
mmetsp:Transcript_56498/g.123818  ORF Transcript_56498/g.123818 Transcript_56498/m.123818 type:complete len:431 (-) Transcript_56498:42-1334(-)|eukprot:CAMPEP_0204392560 /NCGR_PEP_ID=MMETSP0469-20131031/61823_1 /ASSEMBLY_ACC=CAM_ASM_000384 /TAXON_ID=2969 /ORGANISM="Oxyrrhis marina" /LENGTH=430 /DNA_ID=CAMNT_0051386541 /DNA_START=65 /DNA_END=1357 /DNA_ORIENTATION=+